ncbi:MAG: hypothetical protein U0R70_08800 [Solirubrobacteraceae bacterium]
MPALKLIHGQALDVDEDAIRREAWTPIVDALDRALALPLPAGDRADLLAARRAGCEIIGRPTIGAAR